MSEKQKNAHLFVPFCILKVIREMSEDILEENRRQFIHFSL